MSKNRSRINLTILVTIVALSGSAIFCSLPGFPTQSPELSATVFATSASAEATSPALSPTSMRLTTTTETIHGIDPFSLISQESLLQLLTDLTAIQPYSGWRNSASQGESEALDYVADTLKGFDTLENLGLNSERQSFAVYNATEIWESRLFLTLDGSEEVEAPADSLRGHRDNNQLAIRFDSDGELNDGEFNPVEVQGAVVFIKSAVEITKQKQEAVRNRIVFVDFDAVSQVTNKSMQGAIGVVQQLVDLEPAGIVLVTHFSDEFGSSHGAFVGDINPFVFLEIGSETSRPPILYTRLEDLAFVGIQTWEDFSKVGSARLVWDADVFSPGESGNLVATIPGKDRSRSLILSAHIDSPNSPGAMDDGAGSVVLLEMARILDAANLQPAVDLVLVWYGSEETGLYGSAHFVATHQDLLDQTIAVLQLDCLTRPMKGIEDAGLVLVSWSYGRFGDESIPWPEYLSDAAIQHGVVTFPQNRYQFESDNTSFSGFNVPNANMIYISQQMEDSPHYMGHIHSPYDDIHRASDVADVLEQMAQVALVAVIQSGADNPQLNTLSEPTRRAVFIASHTQAEIMSPISFTEFGMALAVEGYDVDMIPYGEGFDALDLETADMVVALPVYDFQDEPGELTDPGIWDEQEIDYLVDYVEKGGFLVITNSAHRIKLHNGTYDINEDWISINALAERFGITYQSGTFSGDSFKVETLEHPLIHGLSFLELMPKNAIPVQLQDGLLLAKEGNRGIIGVVGYGASGGQVLVLADIGLLGNVGLDTPENLQFWLNIARYAYSH